MIVQIRTRSDEGKFHEACAYDFAQAAIDRIEDHGWEWLRCMVGKFCIGKAVAAAESSDRADLWYRRYQAIREIK